MSVCCSSQDYALGKVLILSLLLGRALGFLGHPLGSLLSLLGLLPGLLHEGVSGLAHHPMLLAGLRYGESYSSPSAYCQDANGQWVLL